MLTTLACGPYFRPEDLVASAAVFFVFKPLAYFAFIQAFRYRVNRPIPMTVSQAARLAGLRAILGVIVVGLGVLVLSGVDSSELWTYSWIYLYLERVVVWWLVGAYGARLVGRRLLGWTISGTLLNAAFDAVFVSGIFTGYMIPSLILFGIAGFIAILHYVGQRDALKLRFSSHPHCSTCQYNLTGNLSGICPECGSPVVATA